MKFFSLIAACLLSATSLYAQEKVMMAFPITDYIVEKDSVSIVQVLLPEGLEVKEKTVGILKKVYSPTDTANTLIGTGRCQLIKGRYLYFGLLQKNLKQKPVAGNLMYFNALAPGVYKGQLFEVISHAIVLQSVEENKIAGLDNVLAMKSRQDEIPVIEQLAADVRFTGTEMAKQGMADVVIQTGGFKGKSLFPAMQAITVTDVENFLKYIKARPDKYAGNTWKFSEIMATWMNAGAPLVIE